MLFLCCANNVNSANPGIQETFQLYLNHSLYKRA